MEVDDLQRREPRPVQAVADLLPLRRSQSDLPAPEADELLVLALRARHPDAGTQLFDRYAPHVRRVLVRVRILPDARHALRTASVAA